MTHMPHPCLISFICFVGLQTVEPEQLGAFFKPGGGVVEPTFQPPPELRLGGIQGEYYDTAAYGAAPVLVLVVFVLMQGPLGVVERIAARSSSVHAASSVLVLFYVDGSDRRTVGREYGPRKVACEAAISSDITTLRQSVHKRLLCERTKGMFTEKE